MVRKINVEAADGTVSFTGLWRLTGGSKKTAEFATADRKTWIDLSRTAWLVFVFILLRLVRGRGSRVDGHYFKIRLSIPITASLSAIVSGSLKTFGFKETRFLHSAFSLTSAL